MFISHHSLLPKHIILRSKGSEFFEYFRTNYLNQDARFPISMWNHWDNHGERTNNRVEEYNTRMTNYCGAADPKIDKAALQKKRVTFYSYLVFILLK